MPFDDDVYEFVDINDEFGLKEEKVKFYCPICKVRIQDEKPSDHFRFVHHTSSDEIIDRLFVGLAILDERITNLCELLEIREK